MVAEMLTLKEHHVMARDNSQNQTEQMAFCAQMEVDFEAAPSDWISGFASQTKGLLPLNGLRHATTPGTTGWYIWCGEESSDAKDFYQPTHTEHLYQDYPIAAKLLGLPVGYRFLVAGDHLDVWFDSSLLDT